MSSSPRNLIVACSFACLLLATQMCGQSSYGQQIQPNNAFENSAYQSNQIIDHSSMSPDSWSAPTTTNTPTNSPTYRTASNTLPYSAAANRPATTFQPSNPAATLQRFPTPTAPTTRSDLGRQIASQVNSSASANGASPSIPDLGAATSKQSPLQFNSLIRQPQTTGSSLAAAPRSPFSSATYSKGSQSGLPLNAPSQPTNPFRASVGELSNSPLASSIANGEFDLGSSVDSLPTANPTSPPATPSAVVGGGLQTLTAPAAPTAPATPARYPLGINGNLPTTPLTNQLVTSPSSPTTYENLGNPPVTAQPNVLNYPSVGPATPLFSQPAPSQQTNGSLTTYRPDLGHLSPNPTFRGRDHDSGLKMDFEDKKKEYPGLGEILATGRYFSSVSGLFLQPAFQQNSAITQFNSSAATATFASSEAFDFDYETAPRLRLGFESKFGPGVEIDYWQFDQGSNVSSFTSNGLNSGQLSSGLFGPSTLTTLEATNAGDTLSAIHSIDIETFSVMFFKEIKFPISRLNGMFGFQYASVFQELNAELSDASGSIIGDIRSTSDLRAYGPKFKFEYYRPIGHTNLEFVTAFGGSVLFGERDQIVTNMQTPAINQFGADEYVLTSDFYGGVQWKKMTAENRAYYVRLGFTHQSWIGGGSAVSAQDNFGLRGFAFEVGLNR